ncbi:MAG: GntR family transcriptional regulator, partial [Deltaproteobacteria bacterium]|nr:GntR family transcriptional regulator [Deltaproteobacteria bacterium]
MYPKIETDGINYFVRGSKETESGENRIRMQLNLNDKFPKYMQIYEYLHGMIRRNKIKLGDKLPTEMELAERFGV